MGQESGAAEVEETCDRTEPQAEVMEEDMQRRHAQK